MNEEKKFLIDLSERQDEVEYEPPTLAILSFIAFVGLTAFGVWLVGGIY